MDLYPPGSPDAGYCLTDRGRRDVLINLESYRAALESCQAVIRVYNETVGRSTLSTP